MKWYQWNTQADFDAWHNDLCKELGYPITSVNQATGQLNPDAAMTTAYTTSQIIEGKVIADVEDKYSYGLKLTELRPPRRLP